MENEEKRMISSYEVIQSIHIGKKEVVFGIDEKEEYPFLVCDCTYDNPLSAEWVADAVGSDDYLEAMQIFTDRVQEQIGLVRAEQEQFKFDMTPFTISVSDTKHTVVNLPQSIDILSLYHKEVFQMSTKFTDDEWLLIFQQRTQSGLSVRKWCDSNQISYDKYKYWEKKLLRRSDPERAVSPMDFVELPQALLPPLSLEQEQSYPFELSFHGLHLKIASHAQLSQLAGILKILQASC